MTTAELSRSRLPGGTLPSAHSQSPEPSAARQAAPTAAARPDPLFHLVLLALSACVLLLAAVLTIRSGTQVLLPLIDMPLPELCTMRRMTGLSCPGCGLTRSFISLAHGDLRSSWLYNPAGVFWFVAIAFQVPYRSVQLWRICRGMPELSFPRAAQMTLLILGVATLLQWAVRFCF
jgi:hypothetical protein